MVEISIIIPAYNEKKRIKGTLDGILEYLAKRKFDYEILVVDDGSKDNTVEIVNGYKDQNVRLLKNARNRGKGYSVKHGILKARYPLVLFSDSDLATPIDELDKFLEHIDEGYDIVIASRNMKESNIVIKQPWYRHLIGKTFPLIVSLIAVRGFKDTQCGFKLFKREAGRKIVRLQTFERFSFDVEILFIAKKLGYKIKEAPVMWIDKEGSTVSAGRDSIRMLRDLFRIRYNNFKDRYLEK